MLETIVTSLISSAALTGLITWLFREWIGFRLKGSIQHEYDRKLEGIRNEYSIELATLRSALQESADFKATRFRFVYERKIAALCDGFGRLSELERLLGEYVSYWGPIAGPEREESRKRYAKGIEDFQNFFVPNRIFFPTSLAERITDVKNDMHKMAMEFMVEVEKPGDLQKSPASHRKDTWGKAVGYVGKELPEIRRSIESAIRLELGENELSK